MRYYWYLAYVTPAYYRVIGQSLPNQHPLCFPYGEFWHCAEETCCMLIEYTCHHQTYTQNTLSVSVLTNCVLYIHSKALKGVGRVGLRCAIIILLQYCIVPATLYLFSRTYIHSKALKGVEYRVRNHSFYFSYHYHTV